VNAAGESWPKFFVFSDLWDLTWAGVLQPRRGVVSGVTVSVQEIRFPRNVAPAYSDRRQDFYAC